MKKSVFWERAQSSRLNIRTDFSPVHSIPTKPSQRRTAGQRVNLVLLLNYTLVMSSGLHLSLVYTFFSPLFLFPHGKAILSQELLKGFD